MSETAQSSSSTGSPQEHSISSKKINTKNLTIYVAVAGLFAAIGLAVLLNYLGTLPLSEVYPGLSFLPRRGEAVMPGVLENAKLAETNQVTVGGTSFLPGLTTASSGKLVEGYTIFYTLKGKVQKVELNGGKYDITVGAFDGSQTYKMNGLSGEGVLKKANKDLAWKDLKAGSDVIVEINVNSPKEEGGQPSVLVAQIQVVAAP